MDKDLNEIIYSTPFLKWAGGKRKLVEVISKSLAGGDRLVEPFVGSGAVFMGTNYKKYLLCDTNADLIGLFNNLKNNTEKLLAETEIFFSGKFKTEEAFYELRERFNTLEAEDIKKSALFVYLNKHAFNGLCRYNNKGYFNVPFGKYTNPQLPIKEMLLFAKKAQIAEFKCLDFKETFKLVKKGDVVYADPPYVPISATSSFTTYAKENFKLEAQNALADEANKAKAYGIRVVISNSDQSITREMYKNSEIESIDVMRSISSKGSTRGKVKELIAIF
ncbi:Dam family site-specific DNA-(adenine-N6)-methyltransferase [Methylotenera sp.]|uniref:DNA adenine methylase n=1 Tax=Methylotenera sp. TaxID=2051956 RepID=UPI00271C3783|nr:Dam family site-specific DNA-(adenine-N6)-methyltransferase [Methylotenera sp.]MDO9206156.1 Dam family site-specific DNA-(adenine-N6)-methyltransferase [Methylotenera sp.]